MKRKKHSTEPLAIPFDDALRRILSAPPQHKKTKKKRPQKSKGS